MATGSHHSSSHHSGSHHSSSHHSSHSSHRGGSYHSSHHSHHSTHYSSPMHVAGQYKPMGYNTLYSEQEYLYTAMPDPAMGGNIPGAIANVAIPGEKNYYAQVAPGTIAVMPNGTVTEMAAAQDMMTPKNLVLHATTQYDANHQKVKVTEPNALGYGSEKPLIHGNSWVLGDAYCLDLDDPYCQANHPKLKKADPASQITASIVVTAILFFLALCNGIYEMLIWIFENINMTEEAFAAVDNAIYFGQFALPLIVVGFSLISRKSVHKMNLMFCKQMLQHYAIEDEKLHFDRTHEFLDICPQCGAARLPDTRECPYCGTSLLRMIEY